MGRILQFVKRVGENCQGGTRQAPTLAASDERILEALDEELWTIAIRIAVLGSYLNHLDEFEIWLGRTEILRWMPSSPIVLLEAGAQLANALGHTTQPHHFRIMQRDLDEAKRILHRVISDIQPNASARKRGELVGAWQALAGSALLAIYDRDRLVDGNDWTTPGRPFEMVCQVLVEVRDGGTPFLDGGQARLPSWAKRRTHRRIPLNELATLQVRGRKYDVRVLDVAPGGLGLDFAGSLVVDDVVRITLQSGRRFWGRIAWCANGRAGIEFASLLPADDPLLSSG